MKVRNTILWFSNMKQINRYMTRTFCSVNPNEISGKINRKKTFFTKSQDPSCTNQEFSFVSGGNKTAKNMCCIDCRNQKRVLKPIKIVYFQGNQENRHRCATLADFFPDPETEGGGVNDLECLLFYYCLK